MGAGQMIERLRRRIAVSKMRRTSLAAGKRYGRLPNIVFKSNQAAFAYGCKYGSAELTPGNMILALVQPVGGLPVDVVRQKDGTQVASLKVASDDGGFYVPATTVSARGPDLTAGDLVIWEPGNYQPELVSSGIDPRCGWWPDSRQGSARTVARSERTLSMAGARMDLTAPMRGSCRPSAWSAQMGSRPRSLSIGGSEARGRTGGAG